MSYIYYTKFYIGQKVVPKLAPNSAIGIVIQIYVINETTNTYLVSWNNGVKAEQTIYEIKAYREKDGAEIN